MKNAQNGFALHGIINILPMLLGTSMPNRMLGTLMISLSLAALFCDYRNKLASSKAGRS